MDDRKQKIEKYFELIERHIIQPIGKKILKESCFATIMLIFSAIDGLGKLTHLSANVRSMVRFKFFIATLGANYENNQDMLWKLRNSLMHNGLNHISLFANTEFGQDYHLRSGPNDLTYINTQKLYSDFKNRYENLRQKILNDQTEIMRIGDRLEWTEEADPNEFVLPVTSPGSVYFITQV